MSFLPEDRSSELRALFFESAAELLQTINEAGLSLEKHPADEELLRSVRRAVVLVTLYRDDQAELRRL